MTSSFKRKLYITLRCKLKWPSLLKESYILRYVVNSNDQLYEKKAIHYYLIHSWIWKGLKGTTGNRICHSIKGVPLRHNRVTIKIRIRIRIIGNVSFVSVFYKFIFKNRNIKVVFLQLNKPPGVGGRRLKGTVQEPEVH